MIHIKDEPLLQQKILAIKKAGKNNVHIISDFDRTITKANYKGKPLPSAYALIRDGSYLTKEYVEEAHKLYNFYHPKEIDVNLSLQEKNRFMQTWWQEHLELMIASGLNKEVLDDILRKYDKIFREGTTKFFTLLREQHIPLLIFSAGLGYLIEGFLRKENLLTQNIRIISNFYNFDKEGKVIGYQGNIIHSFNKSEVAVSDKYKQELVTRKNILLLGDSLGDLGMSEGLEHDTIITIGFLNEKINEHLETYKENYDVVITEDGSFTYITELLRHLFSL